MPIPLVNNDHKHTLYYDAHCLLCSKAMQFIRKIDSQRRILILPNTQLPANYSFVKETVVFVADNRSVYYFSTAVIQCLSAIGGVYKFALIAYCIPKFMRDALYKLVARNRKRFFKYSTCSLPLKNK